MLAFAIALGLFFFLSTHKAMLWNYASIQLILLLHFIFFTEQAAFTILLALFLAIDSSIQLTEKEYIRFWILTMVLILFMMIWQSRIQLENLLVISFVFILLFKINRMQRDRLEQIEIYEEVAGEYRRLKRLSLGLEQQARLEERTRIARDIHDSVGHRLTALIMKLEMLSIQNNTVAYDELKELAKASLEETRDAVKALQAEDNEGISTVVNLIRKLEAESHLLVQFTMKQGVLSIPLSNVKNVVLYRIIQESLTNAMRHAGAREVYVTLGKSAIGDLSFEVKNRVFEPRKWSYGFGLSNMKKRVEEVHGMISIYQTEEMFIVAGTIPREGE
ncbi:sensor histidine kinase [Oceanobacillus piezotolerans]|uniref:histidine kinase n=2 Tax=Oceanobacillus piezotolerans TaxID=2448030 RepID=A0A498DCN0_9BACI|nr:sensor histidine kinase [Oceanobacillus piezotolerans]